jgi:hypothetical protein
MNQEDKNFYQTLVDKFEESTQLVGMDGLTGALSLSSDKSSVSLRDWDIFAADLKKISRERLPLWIHVNRIGSLPTLIPNYIKDVLWYCAICNANRFDLMIGKALSYQEQEVMGVTGDMEVVCKYSFWDNMSFKNLYRKVVKHIDKIETVIGRIKEIDGFMAQAISDREDCRISVMTEDELLRHDEYKDDHPYEVGGVTYSRAIMLARFGDYVDTLMFGEYQALLWHVGEVSGI